MDDGRLGGRPMRKCMKRTGQGKAAPFQAIQLWLNLPQAHKMSAPAYQTLVNDAIPAVDLEGGSGRLHVIAGRFEATKRMGAHMHPVELYDL